MPNYEHWSGMNIGLAQTMHVRQWSSLGALALLLWDLIVSWSSEYNHIWSAPAFKLKYIYVFFRYSPIVTQSANYYILLTTLAHPPIPTHICVKLFYAQLTCAQSCLTAMEGVLMLRVYALYNQSPAIGWSLVILFILQTTLASIIGYRTRRTITFDDICTARGEGADVFIFGGGVIIIQIVIWVLTLNKRALGSTSERNKHVINLLIRDGAWAFAVVVLVFAFIMPYTFLVDVPTHLIFSWPNSLFSIAGCRVIINIQHLKSERLGRHSQRGSSDIELSTVLDIDDSFESDSAFMVDDNWAAETIGEVKK
ncbi:hypothetical protein BDQ12DRAFT_729489 [Crucibulum laeve]|uniref:DUF6533 domain-containing protein n=1 Tax=Crucibulum laeve TaxID=68775 RepID=A0A5C3LEJ4_9AGAR|nr:hypothetical protein BDQ12DRAFT_729489 [Crucibulum laeve]